jgi:prepilin peptidase CpaA
MQVLADFTDALRALFAHPGHAALLATMALAAFLDARTLRIPNWLTLAGVVAALAFHTVPGVPGALGWTAPVAGVALALALLVPLWILRVMGAGDVKLMAVVGAFLGPANLIPALLFSFVAAGLLAIAWAVRSRTLGRLGANLRFVAMCLHAVQPAASAGRIPYAVGACAGTALFLLARQRGLF